MHLSDNFPLQEPVFGLTRLHCTQDSISMYGLVILMWLVRSTCHVSIHSAVSWEPVYYGNSWKPCLLWRKYMSNIKLFATDIDKQVIKLYAHESLIPVACPRYIIFFLCLIIYRTWNKKKPFCKCDKNLMYVSPYNIVVHLNSTI
jgi:hypothetical protein